MIEVIFYLVWVMLEIEPLAHFNFSKVFIFILLFTNSNYPQKFPNPEVHKLLEVGIEYILNQNYELANEKFNLLSKRHPELPLGKIYLALSEIIKASDLGEDVNPKILDDLDKTIELSEKLADEDPSNIWNHYYAALSKGCKSYYHVLNGEWLSVISNGLSSVNNFEDCLELDSSFYESYVAIGAYKFWKSRKLEFLEWLPFVEDNSEEGILYLEQAVKKTIYSRHLAAISLIWIYIELKQNKKAIELAERELRKNPINRTLKWALGRAYEDLDLKKSINIYNQLIISYQAVPNQNYYQETILKHILAQQYVKLGEYREARRLCDEILSNKKMSENVRERLMDRLKKVKKLKKDLTN
ncbi:MAG: hypothetical protein HXY50_13530 [Ignavibacteriaceae bacterium]|nr:hypothetical protein [Ignavibacteriaceae bacterium]